MSEPVKVSVLELRRLLIELRGHRPDICIRYRLIGKMWAQNFSRIVRVTEKGMVLRDENTDSLITIFELSQVIQFELGQSLPVLSALFPL